MTMGRCSISQKREFQTKRGNLGINVSECSSFSPPLFFLPGRCMFAMVISHLIAKYFHGRVKSIMD